MSNVYWQGNNAATISVTADVTNGPPWTNLPLHGKRHHVPHWAQYPAIPEQSHTGVSPRCLRNTSIQGRISDHTNIYEAHSCFHLIEFLWWRQPNMDKLVSSLYRPLQMMHMTSTTNYFLLLIHIRWGAVFFFWFLAKEYIYCLHTLRRYDCTAVVLRKHY